MPKSSDNIETKVLRELRKPGLRSAARLSYSELAGKIGENKESVRAAVQRAERAMFIEKWRIILNPHAIGQELGGLQLDARLDDEGKARALAQIQLIEGVALVMNYHGSGVRVIFYYDSETAAQRKAELMTSICNCKKEDAIRMKLVMPPSDPLRKTDWMILGAISKNPRKRTAEIASELGLSSRTVNRLLKKLTDSRAIFLTAVRDVQRSLGLTCNYLVSCDDRAKRGIATLLEGKRLDFAQPFAEYYPISVFLDNIAEAEDFKKKLEKVEGVRWVRMDILKDFIFVEGWIDEVIQRNAAV